MSARGYTQTVSVAVVARAFRLALSGLSGCGQSVAMLWSACARATRKSTAKSTAGYTLIEMIVVIAIATMTLVAVTTAIIYFYRSNTVVFNQGLAVESARGGLSRASSDMRGATYGDDGSYPVVSIATSTFTFFADTDGNGSAEKIRYVLSGTNLLRGVIAATGSPATYPSQNESTTTVSSYVRNTAEQVPVFRFYTASSTEITTFSTTTAVAYVTMTLVVDVDESSHPSEYTLRTTAALRNAPNF